MPSVPAQIIQRQRVIVALEEALASSYLVVLTAPLGHGKTTAAQQLMARWENSSFYLRMKPGWQDNADYLWNDACNTLEEQGLREAGALRLIGFPNDDARMYRCLAFFRDHLSLSPTLLVVDDFHHCDPSPLNRFFENLIYEELSGFNLLILSRTKPSLPLAYLQVKGYASVLDSTVLDFSREEARQLFSVAGEDEHESADCACSYSQGWAAALRMCLQSYMADNIITPVKNVEELLSHTFFGTYSKQDQCLLLQLSVLDSFSKEQAVFITGEKDAPSRLRALYEQNAFIQYSQADDTYSIHALLRSFLLQRLDGKAIPACKQLDVRLLYRRAAECSLKSKNYLQAMRLLTQAGKDEDLLQILRMFEQPGDGFFMVPDPTGVAEIIEAIPWKIRFLSPIGYLGFIHRYMVRVNRKKAGEMANEAAAHFLQEGILPEALQRRVHGEIELIRAIRSFNNFYAMGEHYEKADALLQGSSSLVNKFMYWTFNCPHSAFLYLKKPGAYASLEKLVNEKLIHFQHISGGSSAGAIELFTAERLLETAPSHAPVELLETAKYKALESAQYSGILAVNFTLARRQLANGRMDGVYDLFDSLRKPVEQRAHPLLLQNLEVCVGYIAAVCNDAERIPAWLLQHEPLTIRNTQAHAFSLMVRGKTIMALKNWPRLLAFAEELEIQTAPLGCLFAQLHSILFKAIALANMYKRNTALSEHQLIQALELAKPDGILTSIAEYGGHLYPLLQRLSHLHRERRNLGQLLRLTKKYAQLGKKQTSKLTIREVEIMEMVRQGANNKDIGATLGITQGSVANSLSRVYSKLGVDSRIEAINKWAEESAVNLDD